MKNAKFVAGFAACGFILSFIFGLFSHSQFLSILLKALIFGIVFGFLGFVISFLAGKFLLEESGNDFDTDISNAGPKNTVSENSTSKGHIVDITIKDEELPVGTSENRFTVGDNHQMLNETDYGASLGESVQNVDTSETDPNVSFMPVKSIETLTNVSSKEAIHPDSIATSVAPATKTAPNKTESAFNDDKGIDTLPDISGFAVDNLPTTDTSAVVEDVDNESGSEFVTTATRSRSSTAEVPEINDASLYAKAISSVLSAEESW